MGITVYLYRLYCNVEQQYVVVWGTDPPTRCPNDASTDISEPIVIQQISEETVIAKDASPEGSSYRSISIKQSIGEVPQSTPVGDALRSSEFCYSFPFDMNLWVLSLSTPTIQNCVGDMVDTWIGPYKLIGKTTQILNSGATVIDVDQSVINHVSVGSFVTLCKPTSDNPNTRFDLGMIIAKGASTITVMNSTQTSYPLGSLIAMTYPIGILTANALAGDTVIQVSSTVLAHIVKGSYMKIRDLTNLDDLGIVINIDTNNLTITYEKPLIHSFSAASPTFVYTRACPIDQVYVDYNSQYITFGEKGLKPMLVPANTMVRLLYTNNQDTQLAAAPAKVIFWKIEAFHS